MNDKANRRGRVVTWTVALFLVSAGVAFSAPTRARLASAGVALGTYVGLTGNETVAGVKTFSSAITSSVASGSMATSILTGARMGLITGDADYLSCDGTTCTFTGTKLAATDDITAGGSLIMGAAQNIQLGTGGIRQGPSNPFLTPAAFTISTAFCPTGGSVVASKTYAGRVDVGTSCAASTGVITLGATANVGWNCSIKNITTPGTYLPQQTATTTTTATFTNYRRDDGTAANWLDGDDLLISCIGY